MRCWGKKWLREVELANHRLVNLPKTGEVEEVERVEKIAWGQGLLDPIFYAFTPLYNPNPYEMFPP
jgi:hypothetical protein